MHVSAVLALHHYSNFPLFKIFRSDTYLAENRLVVAYNQLSKRFDCFQFYQEYRLSKEGKKDYLDRYDLSTQQSKKLFYIFVQNSPKDIENMLYSRFLTQFFQIILFHLRRNKIIIFFSEKQRIGFDFSVMHRMHSDLLQKQQTKQKANEKSRET